MASRSSGSGSCSGGDRDRGQPAAERDTLYPHRMHPPAAAAAGEPDVLPSDTLILQDARKVGFGINLDSEEATTS